MEDQFARHQLSHQHAAHAHRRAVSHHLELRVQALDLLGREAEFVVDIVDQHGKQAHIGHQVDAGNGNGRGARRHHRAPLHQAPATLVHLLDFRTTGRYQCPIRSALV
ncbi:hypothetical protein D3C72_1792720 [compost metagenome]